MPGAKYIECGKIVNTHGVAGALKLESMCNTPEDLASLPRIFIPEAGGALTERKIIKSSVLNRFVIVRLEGIESIENAEKYKNKRVFASREDFNLAEGEYFLADLIGLEVIDRNTSKIYGKVSDIINRGSSDIYVVDTPYGERMVPAVPEFIAQVDINKGIYVVPIEGMFDE